MSPSPYWQSDDGAIVVYHAHCEDVFAAGLVPVREVALTHADPPYGIGGVNGAGRTGTPRTNPRRKHHRNCAERIWPALAGGADPFDPAPLLALGRPLVLWGANHYSGLPGTADWIVWDKRDGTTPTSFADAELAWTNLGGSVRIFAHRWGGFLRASENGDPSLHPTQKPIALCSWVYQRAKLKPGALVFVPYLGSGPDLPAARAAGLRVIACEVERAYCDTAIARLGAVTPERAREPTGPLFAPRSP